jgi:chemotaxis protein CheX
MLRKRHEGDHQMGAPQIKQNPLVDKAFINAFGEGVMKTLQMMAQTNCKPKAPRVEPKFQPTGDVAGMVGMVAGPMKGTLTISFSKESIFKILENMLGETYTEINNDVGDAVGELTNQIYGSAKTTLNQLGYSFDMAIPTVIRGQFQISKYHSGATLIIPFAIEGSPAEFSIEITVQTAP